MRLIDADSLKKHLDYVCVGGGKWGDAEKAFINAFKDFIDGEITIQLEPKSAQQWIPCSERLPDNPRNNLQIKRYIVCDEDGDVNSMMWCHGWNCSFDKDGNISNAYEIKDIVAWMPLPEPYKGDEDA